MRDFTKALSFVSVLSLFVMCGCGTSLPTFPLASGAAVAAYVLPQSPTLVAPQVLTLPLGQSGNVVPADTLSVPGLMGIQSTATDHSGHLYVGGIDQAANFVVWIFESPTTSSTVPIQTVNLPSNFVSIYSLFVDGTGNLYVAMETAVLVYSRGPDGTFALKQTISGPATNIFIPGLITADSAGNTYVTFEGGIEVFASGSTGNIAPSRVITAPANSGYEGIAVDAAGNIYASYSTANTSSILEFAPTAAGAAVPLKQITFPDFGAGYIYGIQIDGSGNIYAIFYQLDATGAGVPSIVAFGPTATGAISPALMIHSDSWQGESTSLSIR